MKTTHFRCSHCFEACTLKGDFTKNSTMAFCPCDGSNQEWKEVIPDKQREDQPDNAAIRDMLQRMTNWLDRRTIAQKVQYTCSALISEARALLDTRQVYTPYATKVGCKHCSTVYNSRETYDGPNDDIMCKYCLATRSDTCRIEGE